MPKKKDPKAPKKRMGRPKIPMVTEDIGKLENKLPSRTIELKQVLYWMDLGATQEEIAGAHYVSVDTLKRRLFEVTGETFAQIKEKTCGNAKIKLRNNQYRMSENNATMAIWLGKQWLGQRDLPIEIQEFNGKLAELLEMLSNMQSENEFNSHEVVVDTPKIESDNLNQR